MSPPSHIHSTLLLLTTGPQVDTSTKPSESYSTTGQHVPTSPYISFSTTTYYRPRGQHVVKTSETYHYYRSPCHHLAIYLILYCYLLQVYRSTRRQNSQKHTSTTGLHLTTSPYILISTTTYYISKGQHVVKALRIILYYKSPCPHLATSLIIYYYQLHVYRSTRRQNSQNHTVTTGHHVTTLNYLLSSANITTNYMSTCQHVVKTLRFLRLPQVTMSPPCHISYSLLLPTTCLQVNMSSTP